MASSRFQFGPLEQRGVLIGFRAGQLAVVATAFLAVLLVLSSESNWQGGLAAMAVLMAGLGLAFIPVRGRQFDQWLPTVWHYRTQARRQFTEPSGPRPRRRHGVHAQGQSVAAPRPFRQLQFSDLELPPSVPVVGTAPAAILHDSQSGTFSAALGLSGRNFGLLSHDEQERRVQAWATLLSAAAREGSVLHRLQWLSVIRPSGPLVATVAAGADAAAISYADLVATSGSEHWRHEVVLVLQIDPRRSARAAVKAAGGRADGARRVLARTLGEIAQLARDAQLEVPGALDRPAFARALSVNGDGGRWPWPMAVEEQWSRARVDHCYTATYWIAQWPRVEVPADFLAPLLLGPSPRVLSVVMAPISPSRAAHEVESARTHDVADQELRSRAGFLTTARSRRMSEQTSRREQELADGHGSFRYCGYLRVDATTPTELEDRAGALEQAAGRCHLELRRCYGRQIDSMTYTLALGRGLA